MSDIYGRCVVHCHLTWESISLHLRWESNVCLPNPGKNYLSAPNPGPDLGLDSIQLRAMILFQRLENGHLHQTII